LLARGVSPGFCFLAGPLAVAAATDAPAQVAGLLMDHLAGPSESDLAGQFTKDVPLPRRG